ncbi:MAG: hypothetical protein AAF621_05795 [Pseudomonadota bacterium]
MAIIKIFSAIIGVFLAFSAYAGQDFRDIDDYRRWHNAVHNSINGTSRSADRARMHYGSTFSYDPLYMGQSWLEEMADIAAADEIFQQDILNASDGDAVAYANIIIENPQIPSYLPGAESAFRRVLNEISKKDAEYRLRSYQYQALARRQGLPREVNFKPISYFSMSNYASTTRQPSIMERLLALAALDVLGVRDMPEYVSKVEGISRSHSMTNCFATAKRNSAQCQAAAHDTYDLSYCMAAHNITEVSECYSWMLP